MHYNDEVIPADRVAGLEVKAKVDERELKMAQQLIDSLSTKFKPEKYHDEYREQVMEVIERKAAGEEIVSAPTVDKESGGRARNLMAALEESLARSRGENNARSRRTPARRRKSD
jgi:DNA end-binding protein Ku